MALDFPSNPTNGQVYDKWVYNSTKGVWQANDMTATPSATAPISPRVGDLWFDTNDGTLYTYYNDGNTTQWVQVQANSALEATILSRLGAVEARSTSLEEKVYSPNYIINGGFDIWQRGTTFTVPASTWTWSADRWKALNTGGVTTCSRESSIVPSFAQYSYKMTQATANATVFAIQTIETSNAIQLAGKTVTLSGYFAASSSTNVLVDIAYSTNVDNGTEASWTGYLTPVSGGSGTVSSTSSFTRISGVYSVPSNAKSLQIRVWTGLLTTGTSLYFSGIQLEEGSVATPFRRNANSIQGELAACQRYFQRYAGYNGDLYPPQSPAANDVPNRPEVILYYTEKRTTPQITIGGTASNHIVESIISSSAIGITSFGGTYVGTGKVSANLFFNATWTANIPCTYTLTGSAYIDISAEL